MVMYGDLVGFGMMLVCDLLFVKPAFQELQVDDPKLIGSYAVILTYVWNTVFSFGSWWTQDLRLNLLASVGYIAMMVCQNYFQFPKMGGMAIVPHFLWLLLVFSCNVGVKLLHKVILGLLALAAMTQTAFHSPGLESDEEREQVIHTFIGSTIAYIIFHFCWALGSTESMAQASLVLTFIYKMSWEIIAIRQDSDYAPEGGIVIVKTSCLAIIGLFALGIFRSEKTKSSNLLAQVEEQEDELHMVGLAMSVSDTAVAITTSCRDIIWFNPAFGRICEMEGKSGSLRRCKVDALQLSKLSSGKFIELFDDITERFARARAEKKAQQESLLSQAMIESMETLTHELRTPLVGVRGITSILVHEDSLTSSVKDSLNLIMASSGLLLVLINNLLDVRKLNANMMEEFPLKPIPLIGPINDAIGFCQPLAAISDVSIDVVTEPQISDALVISNGLRLQQVIINLISNAIKYTPTGGVIQISSSLTTIGEIKQRMDSALATGEMNPNENTNDERTNDEERMVIVVSVTDPGTGIPPGQEIRLFRKFAMLDSSEREGKLGHRTAGQPSGTGLGLNLCLKFVQLMNGNIWAENNASGRGSTFSFYLPAQKVAPSVSGTKAPVGKTTKPTFLLNASFAEYRVLLVDDTLINRKVFASMIQRIGISQIQTVESGFDALEILEKDPYDLVISDIQMPGMSGMELAEAIKKSQSLRKQPVIVGLTADMSEKVEKQCLESGMADVLHKPITVDELVLYFDTVVRRLLDAAAEEENSAVVMAK